MRLICLWGTPWGPLPLPGGIGASPRVYAYMPRAKVANPANQPPRAGVDMHVCTSMPRANPAKVANPAGSQLGIPRPPLAGAWGQGPPRRWLLRPAGRPCRRLQSFQRLLQSLPCQPRLRREVAVEGQMPPAPLGVSGRADARPRVWGPLLQPDAGCVNGQRPSADAVGRQGHGQALGRHSHALHVSAAPRQPLGGHEAGPPAGGAVCLGHGPRQPAPRHGASSGVHSPAPPRRSPAPLPSSRRHPCARSPGRPSGASRGP